MYKFYVPANSFNLLRLICCFIVIFEHTVLITEINVPILNLRGVAVNIFFILSGFWVTYSYFKSNMLKDYIVKRFIKIFPQYWFVIFCSAFFLFFFSNLNMSEYFFTPVFFKYIFANLTTLNFLQNSLPGVFEGGGHEGAVNGSLWTIKIEIGFYIILPFFFYLWKKMKNESTKRGVLILFYILSVLYKTFIPYVIEKSSLPTALNNQLPAFISYFISGIVFIIYWEKLKSKLNLLVLPCLCLYICFSLMNVPFLSELIMPITLSIIIMWIGFKIKFAQNISINIDYSYGMYLVHYPIIMCLLECGVFELHWLFGIFLVTGTSFFCAFILEKIQTICFSKIILRRKQC